MAVLQTSVWRVRPGKTQSFLENVAAGRKILEKLGAQTRFINQVLGTDYDEKTIYGWLAMGRLPYGKLGTRIIGSKRAIRQRLAQAAGITA